ncbi:hypothetical protein DYB28_005728, partial [Aphanomyces astaci]
MTILQERQALVKDLESMRLQLLRKDDQCKKSAAVASSQLIALKKELGELHSQRVLVEKESDLYQQKCKDLTTLLETSYDQHEEDQTKIVKLSENYDDGLNMARKEATISVMNTHEERKSLKVNAERLRCKLNTERKEWMDTKQSLLETVEEHRSRTDCLERELREAKLSEKSYRMCQDQLQAEIRSLKHDLSAAVTDHSVAKLAIEKYKNEICRVVEETRMQRDSDQTLLERLHMAQEDATMSWRSRTALFHENCTLKQNLYAAQQKYDGVVSKRKQDKAASSMLTEELSEVRRDTKRMSMAWEAQSVEQTQRMKRSHIEAIDLLKERHAAELLQLTVENERKLAKSDASHRVMLEELGAAHRDQVQAARDVVEKQMHMAVNQVQVLCESTQHKLLSVTKEVARPPIDQIHVHTWTELSSQVLCVNMQKEGAEMQVRELQQELDAWRDKEKKLIQIMEHAQRMNANVEERHLSLECKHLDAQKQLEELALSVQSLHATADEYVRELGGVETEKLECRREIAHLQEQHSRDVLALEVMKRNQDHTIKQITQAQFNDLQTLLKQTNHQVSVLEREKQKLARVVEEQAVTIHELTMQDEHGVNAVTITDELSSAITFVIYGVSSFCILTAYSTVVQNFHAAGCRHGQLHRRHSKEHAQGGAALTTPAIETALASQLLPAKSDDDGDDGDDQQEATAPVPYWDLMPKHSALQQHHMGASTTIPLYTCVCQLPVAIPVPTDGDAMRYPKAYSVSVSRGIGPTDCMTSTTRMGYDDTGNDEGSRCRSASCPAARNPHFRPISHHNAPLPAPAATTKSPPRPPSVLLALTAQANTRERRHRSLFRANIQVGLAVASVSLEDVYSVRVELKCPDNAESHAVAAVLWGFTCTMAEMKTTRDLMQCEVDGAK